MRYIIANNSIDNYVVAARCTGKMFTKVVSPDVSHFVLELQPTQNSVVKRLTGHRVLTRGRTIWKRNPPGHVCERRLMGTGRKADFQCFSLFNARENLSTCACVLCCTKWVYASGLLLHGTRTRMAQSYQKRIWSVVNCISYLARHEWIMFPKLRK